MVAGILAHVDAGKTTLSEALLYETGQIRRMGRVDQKDAFLDTEDLERERGITIFSKQARVLEGDLQLTLLDTPGHVDFAAEMERTLQVLDYAVLVVSGADGVQGHTRTLWRLLKHYQVPVFLFVNKMDLPGAERNVLMEELQRELSPQVVDCTDAMQWALAHMNEEQKGCSCDQNHEMRQNCTDGCNVENWQEKLWDIMGQQETFMENVAVCEDGLLECYMEKGMMPLARVQEAVGERKIVPCFFGAALRMDGVREFWKGFRLLTRPQEYGTEFAARVYKIGRDDKGARLTFLKVLGGNLAVRDKICYGELTEKVDQIRLYSGSRFETSDVLHSGEVAAVTGLSGTFPGQGLGMMEQDNTPVLEPVLGYQMILPPEVNPAEFMKALRQLEEEDPQLYVVWKEELQEIHVQLMGQVQMEVLVHEIKERFGVVVRFGPGSIVYKETVAEPVEGVGHFEPLRHYAEVHLLIEPGETGSGVVVDSVCSEDLLDRNWQRLIATHVLEREHKGVLTGSALTDVKITILTGKAHNKHTEGGDFRQATYRAIRQGLMRGRCLLLEPYYRFRLMVPTEYVGRAMTDLEQRHARMDTPEFLTHGGKDMASVAGRAPVSTMQDYVREIQAYTQGLGELTLEVDGYDVCHNSMEVIETCGYDSEQDYRNPTGSVFCAHGAGFVVPWDEVDRYMHLPYIYEEGADAETLRLAACHREDGFYYACEENAINAGQVIKRGPDSWSKAVASMSEAELDAELMDVYRREFGGDSETLVAKQRQKWGKEKAKPVMHVKLDKKGNPIYKTPPKQEEILIVDGYNILFAWENTRDLMRSNMDAARGILMDALCNYQGYRGGQVLLVFDAYRVKGNAGREEDYQNIRVVYTREDETADAYIERYVHDIRDRYKVTVATSDGLEQQTVMSLGALRMSARELQEIMERTNREGYEEYQRNQK